MSYAENPKSTLKSGKWKSVFSVHCVITLLIFIIVFLLLFRNDPTGFASAGLILLSGPFLAINSGMALFAFSKFSKSDLLRWHHQIFWLGHICLLIIGAGLAIGLLRMWLE